MSSIDPLDFGLRLASCGESPAALLRSAWQQGREPALEGFLAQHSNVSPAELSALICVDLESRWRRRDRTRPEDYFARFPIVAADAELAIDVIYAEFLAREQEGDRPDLDEFQARFPGYADTLAEQIELHRALDMMERESAAQSDPAAEPSGTTDDLESGLSANDATYEILDQIGSGGMGVVYRARQAALDRLVALKMVRAIDAENLELLARFRSEAHVVASLRHPHIVQVYDYGEHDGLPYLAMELVEGGSLAGRLDGSPWPPRDAATLLIKLADAVDFAHQRQVIHRDLKPANVLVTSDASELEVKITDFGLAKFLAQKSSQHTKSYAFLGTPSYMAPEQARGGAREVGPATDIYSLGAILYELLTGQPPFRGETPVETLRLLLSSDPISIFQLAPRTPRDLATICEKCLQTDPARRYPSAAQLREDLTRYLDGRPIQARPVGNLERARRWCRRNPLLAAAFGSVAVLLLGIAVMSLWYSAQLSDELERTRQVEQAERAANLSAQRRLWDSYLTEAAARNGGRQVGRRFAALESIDKAAALLPTIGRSEDRELQLRNAILSSAALPDVRVLREFALSPLNAYGVALSLRQNFCVVTAHDHSIAGFRLSDGKRLWTIEHSEPLTTPIVSPDGRLLAAIGKRSLTVWQLDETEPRPAWEVEGVQFLTFSPRGEFAAYGTKEAMQLVRAASGEIVRTLGSGPSESPIAFDPRTGRIAVGTEKGVTVISLESGAIDFELSIDVQFAPVVAWHPGGKYMAIWQNFRGIGIWDIGKRTKVFDLAHRGVPAKLTFNDDGSILVTETLWDRRMLAWDVGNGQPLLEVPDFTSRACEPAANGHLVFAAVNDDKVAISELSLGARLSFSQSFDPPVGHWSKVSISPESRLVAFSGDQGVELWDLKTRSRLFAQALGSTRAAFNSAGDLFLGFGSAIYRLPRQLEVVSAAAGEEQPRSIVGRTVVRYGPPERLASTLMPTLFQITADGQSLLYLNQSRRFALQSNRSSEALSLQHEGDARMAALSNDNRFVVLANWEMPGATVLDAHSAEKITNLPVGRHGAVQFSPDGQFLAATPNGVTLWHAEDWRQIANLHASGTTPAGLGIVFSPDSRVLAVGQVNGVLSFVDPRTGTELVHILHHELRVASHLAFSSDQRWLVTTPEDERSPSQVWDLTALRRDLQKRNLDWPADVLCVLANPGELNGDVEVVIDDRGLFDRPTDHRGPSSSQEECGET